MKYKLNKKALRRGQYYNNMRNGKMKPKAIITKLSIIVYSIIVVGCAGTGCYIEGGLGTNIHTVNSHTENPAELNAYCTKGNYTAGFYHESDISKNKPFDQGGTETEVNKFQMSYRVRLF